LTGAPLTHDEDGVPAPAGQIRHVVQGAEDGPRKSGTDLGAEAFISGHP